MRVTVIGAGYVGLVTATCFAEIGHEVLCIEKDSKKIEKLKNGVSPFYEPGLDKMLEKNIRERRLFFSGEIKNGVEFSEIIYLCVGTPQAEDGRADLSQIEEVSRLISKYMKSYKLIVEKSTVPVNTHRWIKRTILRFIKNKNIKFDVASNPEFLREGAAINDFMDPDRIVIGVESVEAKSRFEKLYERFKNKGYPILFTTPGSAELIKHAANSFLAMKISYINMIADLCEKTGADIDEVAKGIGYDKRIGNLFLNAGIGYGGSCFPKDVKAFIKIAEKYGIDFTLLRETERINNERRKKFMEKVEEVLWISKDKNIAIWGLSFKPNTDDIREAPSLYIVKELERLGAHLYLYDPKAIDNFKVVFPEKRNLKYGKEKYEVLDNADALLILTDWEEFKDIDLKRMKELMRLPIVIDGRNIFDGEKLFNYDFEYYNVGKKLTSGMY